jgi:hypothetical protein
MTDPKATLFKLNQNLNNLRERDAKYAGNAPLELLNQIRDHQQAIDLTRRAITGELDEAEWRESLKSLLLAVQDGQVVNLETETYIAGDIKGDTVSGDKIITHIYSTPPPSLPPAKAEERHNLGILLNKVKTFWIEGVLEKSIHNMALIDLGKETQIEAVSHAWEQVLELPDQKRQILPADKKMSKIFDEMNRALLILGVPGSGKTITLLQLARDLIAQAELDGIVSQPVPVVFNLATWTRGQSLVDWLVAELSAKYQIPRRIGRPWLESNRLLPLLDGLDEVRPAERLACVEAINHFRTEFGLSGLAVCSRWEEYTSLPVRLKLNGAIRLQPLTLEQVCDYLEAAGSKLEVLLTALQVDDDLKILAKTPLTLGIMILAYQDISIESLIGQSHRTLEARRKHLLDTYVERMFLRKGKNKGPYRNRQIKAWLSWLAQGMHRHNQGIFLIEQLQPSWLSSRTWVWAYVLGSRIITLLFWGLMIGLASPSAARYLGLTDTLIPGLGGWLIACLVFGLISGIFLGLIDGVRFERIHKDMAHPITMTRRQQGINILVVGLVLGLTAGLLGNLFAGLVLGLMYGVAAVVVGGAVFGSRGIHQSLTYDIQTVEALSWSWSKALKTVPFGLLGGIIMGLSFGLTAKLNQELVNNILENGPIFSLTGERGFVLCVGVSWGIWGGVITAMFGGLNSKIVKTKTVPNQGIGLSVRNALVTGPGFGLIIGLVTGLHFWLFQGFWNGLNLGLFCGLTVGAIAFLWYGGSDAIQHYTLRFILWVKGHMPRNYISFLDYAVERIFLQKVGGGYIFIHRLLLEHFAEIDIKGKQFE